MAKENVNLQIPNEGTDSVNGAQQQKRYLGRLELLRLLMELLKDVKSKDLLSKVLQHCTESQDKFDKDEVLNEIKNFSKEGYINLEPVETVGGAEEQDAVDVLLQEENHDKILVNLKQHAFTILFDSCAELSEDISKLNARQSEDGEVLEELKENWKDYDDTKERILTIEQRVEETKNEIISQKDDWEEKLKKSKEEWKENRKEVLGQAEKLSESIIEKELEMSGKIGQAMQNMQKDIIQFMVIFITIFTMVGLDLKNIGAWSVAELFRVNIIICASMSALMTLVSIIMASDKRRTVFMCALSVILWGITLLSAYAG